MTDQYCIYCLIYVTYITCFISQLWFTWAERLWEDHFVEVHPGKVESKLRRSNNAGGNSRGNLVMKFLENGSDICLR